MPSFINKLRQLSYQLGEKYRLAGQPFYSEIELTFRLLGLIANSHSNATPAHTQQMMTETEILRLSEQQIRIAIDAFSSGQQMTTDLVEASLRFFQGAKLAQEMILQSCWRMIWADKHLGVREYQLVHLWGYWLGWPRADIEQLGIAYRPVYLTTEHKQALLLLGVTADSSPTVIRQMYKKQLSRYHPDKIMGAGASPDKVNEATEQTTKIQEAYTLIKMLHDF